MGYIPQMEIQGFISTVATFCGYLQMISLYASHSFFSIWKGSKTALSIYIKAPQ